MFRFPIEEPDPTSTRCKKIVECQVIHPDQSLYSFQVPLDCKGQECLDRMCDIMGIVEKDYFGLQYVDKGSGCSIWINNRLQVRNQTKTKPPFHLKFRVKFYTDPDLLLQPSTVLAFFRDLKFQLKRGDVHVSDQRKSIIGAYLAQADFGDHQESLHGMSDTRYPPYFPHWNGGIAYLIAKQHRRMRGYNQYDAMRLLLMELYPQEELGVSHVPAVVEGDSISLCIGSRHISIIDCHQRCQKIPYQTLTQVSFGKDFFGINYQPRAEEQHQGEKKLRFYVKNHTVAKSLFRSVTEEQVFFYQTTVNRQVLEHADNRHRKVKKFCEKYFRMRFETKYYYDVLRTKNEAYRHAWQQLNQTGEREVDNTVLAPSAVTEEEEEDMAMTSSLEQKSEVCWGLSTSSSNIAKQLLSESQLRLTDSGGVLSLTCVPHEETQENDDDQIAEIRDPLEPLNPAQGKKLQQLLLKIQDEKLCHVCMDELISSVFCPCGHYVACYRCARRLDKCPICRQPVGYVQYVYTVA